MDVDAVLAKTLLADMGIVGPAQAAPKGTLTADKLAAATAGSGPSRTQPGQVVPAASVKGHV
jgi:hypothetical protein